MTKVTKFLFSYWFLFTLLCRLHSRKSVETAVIHAACWERFKNSVHTKKLKNCITPRTPLHACRRACLNEQRCVKGQGRHDWEIYRSKSCWHEHTYFPSCSFYFFIHLFYLEFFFFSLSYVLPPYWLAFWLSGACDDLNPYNIAYATTVKMSTGHGLFILKTDNRIVRVISITQRGSLKCQTSAMYQDVALEY